MSMPSTSRCAGCGEAAKAGRPLLTCGSCKAVRYCDAACQKIHWKEHKRACKTATFTLKQSGGRDALDDGNVIDEGIGLDDVRRIIALPEDQRSVVLLDALRKSESDLHVLLAAFMIALEPQLVDECLSLLEGLESRYPPYLRSLIHQRTFVIDRHFMGHVKTVTGDAPQNTRLFSMISSKLHGCLDPLSWAFYLSPRSTGAMPRGPSV